MGLVFDWGGILLRGAVEGGGDKAITSKHEMEYFSLHAIAQIEEQRLNLSRS